MSGCFWPCVYPMPKCLNWTQATSIRKISGRCVPSTNWVASVNSGPSLILVCLTRTYIYVKLLIWTRSLSFVIDSIMDDRGCDYKHDSIPLSLCTRHGFLCSLAASKLMTSYTPLMQESQRKVLTDFWYMSGNSVFTVDELLHAWQILLYLMVPLVMGLPRDILYKQTRFFFLRTLVRLAFPIQVCCRTWE